MGSTFITEAINKDLSPDEVLKAFRHIQEDARNEYGTDGYNGAFNNCSLTAVKTGLIFETERAAYEYLKEHTEKREAMAVRVKKQASKPVLSKAGQDLKQRLTELGREISNFPSEIVNRVKTGKAKTRGCDKCGSAVATAYIRHASCPVCSNADFIITKTDRERLASLRAKQKDLTKRFQEETKKALLKVIGTDTYWLVGGWAPC